MPPPDTAMFELVLQAVSSLPQEAEFWAAVVGSLCGSAGTGIVSYFLQRQLFAKEELRAVLRQRDDRRRLMRSMIAKAMQVSNSLSTILGEVREARRSSDKEKISIGLAFLPLVNLPERVRYSEDEKGLLLELNETEAFNRVQPLNATYDGTIEILAMHRTLKREFEVMTEVEVPGPRLVKLKLTPKVQLKITQLEMLIGKLEEHIEEDFNTSKNIVRMLVDVQARKLDISSKVSFKS